MKIRQICFDSIFAAGVFAALSATAANSFRVTPYVQHPKTDAMSILWFANEAGNATLKWWKADSPANVSAVTTTGVAEEKLAGSVDEDHGDAALGVPFKHRTRLTGLQPDTAYTYQVELAGGAKSKTYTFRTPPAAFRPVRFVAYSDSETQKKQKFGHWEDPLVDGDNGSKTGSRRYLVDKVEGFASNLVAMAQSNPDFMVAAGDLAGAGSDQTCWDRYWDHNAGKFDDPAGSIPLLAAIGNHDYAGYDKNADFGERGAGKFHCYFEVEESNAAVDEDQKWRFHRVDYGPVALIFIDPNNGPNFNKSTTWERWADEYAKPNPFDTNQCLTEDKCRAPDFNVGSPQYKWVEEQLKDAQKTKAFTFMVCHQCPYSIGYHGRANGDPGCIGGEGEYLSGMPTRCYTNLVFKYGVDGWICGHDEICEHSRLTGTEILPDGSTRPTEIHVYDVGYGADDLRGARRTAKPNEYEVFRAHTDAPEVYAPNGDHNTGVGLVSGGKHYGHLEVNVTTNDAGECICNLRQNYVFITKDPKTGKLSFDKRTYPDQVTLTNALYKAVVKP